MQTTIVTLQESKKLSHFLMLYYQTVSLNLVFSFNFCTWSCLQEESIRYPCRLLCLRNLCENAECTISFLLM